MRRSTFVLIVTLLTVIGTLWPAPANARSWASAGSATITPGVQMYTNGAQCTANFVFEDAGGAVYLGYAAHCAGLGEATDTNGCLAPSLPLGTLVEIDGATRPGRLAYSSWHTMQVVGETDGDACSYNDLALVALDPADYGRVNPSVPHWGGPVGLHHGETAGEVVYSYGNSSLRLGFTPLSPKEGLSLDTIGNGWAHMVYTATPGIPGDSGSGFLSADGRATGVLSTLAIAPYALSNNVSDLASALAYAGTRAGFDVSLVPGTETFDPDGLPLGL